MLITIDGKQYEAFEDETVLQVAKRNNIYIPTLCYHVKTGQLAKCRVCLVIVDGMRGYQTACNLKVKDAMVVTVNSDALSSARKTVVDLIVSSGRHDCLSCQRNGDCELQDVCYALGIERPSYKVDTTPSIDVSSQFVFRDNGKCIRCNRCVEGCNNIVVNEVLNTGYRGKTTKIICDEDLPMGTSTCVQCGECVQLCPTGALVDTRAIGQGRIYQLDKVKTICPYCGVGCTLVLHVDRNTNHIVQVTGDENSIVNKGMLCVKGRYGFDFVNDSKRLTKPLLKNDKGTFDEISWDQAFKHIADKFTSIKSAHGPDAIAGFASAKVTNEENYLFQKFIRKEIGTNNVDHCARLCHASTVAGLAISFGSGAMTNDIPDVDKADVILVIGSDTTSAHPVIGSKIKQAVRFGKSKLIVIDPKKIALARHAQIYARQRCGTDVAVINGIMHIILKNGWQDKEYIEQRCENFDAVTAEVENYTPEMVEKISGIPASKLYEIAELFGKASVASVFYSMGITQHTTGIDNVMSIANLQMMCGNLGKIGGGVNPLRGQNNVQGACDMGALPNVYPGYQKVDDTGAQEKFEKAWGVKLSKTPGLTITEVLDSAIKGTTKALYIMGENPQLSDPDQHHVEKALKSLDFLVVQDIFLTETAQ
ncbi:MAG: molybdopterin-dependent oxidoreductase, partial [Fibrobacterota bacterium]|nr:molybdopterin-dependent oxidoreductase [Chitinispirillaceae bacterium]